MMSLSTVVDDLAARYAGRTWGYSSRLKTVWSPAVQDAHFAEYAYSYNDEDYYYPKPSESAYRNNQAERPWADAVDADCATCGCME